jgi:hypothetical protein
MYSVGERVGWNRRACGNFGAMVAAQKLIIRIVGMVQQMWTLENISFGRAY